MGDAEPRTVYKAQPRVLSAQPLQGPPLSQRCAERQCFSEPPSALVCGFLQACFPPEGKEAEGIDGSWTASIQAVILILMAFP